jgi:predicted phosphate transport protein (TIGR00153 family)
MLSYLFKKQSQVEKLIYDYLDTLKSAQKSFLNALEICLLNDVFCENFEYLIIQTHKFESKADDIREEVKSLMYEKALIPESRGDIMLLLDTIDTVPHLFEKVLYSIQTQKLTLPDFIMTDTKELIKISLECCDLMIREVIALFKKNEGIRDLVTQIDSNESHCDHIERRIITKLFDTAIDPFQKLQLKELIGLIGEISDQADRVSKRINIINIKRRV